MGDEPLRRYVEAHGFHIESGAAETYVMRRDLHDGTLVEGAEDARRICPSSASQIRPYFA
jgi:hypothetical protein